MINDSKGLTETEALSESALVPTRTDGARLALQQVFYLWASATTSADTVRREDLLRDKQRAVTDFFAFTRKAPGEVSPLDVKGWQAELEARGKRSSTIYVRVSFLSSFYNWAMRDPELSHSVVSNPVTLARPRAPKAYQTESVKSWTDDELQSLVSYLAAAAQRDDLIVKRDYALLRLYLATGLRRQEVISLRGKDIRITDVITIASKMKGGNYRAKEVRDPEVKEALLDYLRSSNRLHVLKTDGPVWTRHDNPKLAGDALTSHAFVRNLKRYAREAGLGDVHLHQTRHTFGRIVSEETGSIIATQDALDHSNPTTTKHYVQRIAVKRDLYSERVAARMKKTESAKQQEA